MIKPLQDITLSNEEREGLHLVISKSTRAEHRHKNRVNNLSRYFKSLAVCAILVIPCVFSVKTFADESIDVSLMNFINAQSFNFKGFDVRIKDITMGEKYNDNITYDHKKAKEDLITNAGLGISALYEGSKNTLEVAGHVYQEVFAKNSDLDYTSQDININFKRELSQCDRISISDVATNTVLPLWFEGTASSARLRGVGRIPYYTNRFTTNYDRDVSRDLTVNIKYANDVDVIDSNSFSDSSMNNIGLETMYEFGTKRLYFLYNFSDRLFADGKNASINTIRPSFRQYFSTKLHATIGCGTDFVDTYYGDKIIRPNIESYITYHMNENNHLYLNFYKRCETNPWDDQIRSLWCTTVTFKRQMSERIECVFAVYYTDTRNIPDNFSGQYTFAKPEVTYSINKNLKGSLRYEHLIADTNNDPSDFHQNIVSLGLKAEF